jgi:hypothetical protein
MSMMLRSGRSLESVAVVEPPTRPVPPSTSTRAVLGGGSAHGGRRRAGSDLSGRSDMEEKGVN